MKPCMAVLFGGASVEHEISIISAVQAMNAVNREHFDVVPVYITKDRELYSGADMFDIASFRNIPELLSHSKHITLSREGGRVYMKYADFKAFGKYRPVQIDIALPAVHGTNCEDGTVAGYLEMLGLPYIGSDPLAASISMDKAVTKSVLREAGLPVLPCVTVSSREALTDTVGTAEKIGESVGYPLIIKPVNAGSSVGISKVDGADRLKEAVRLACSFSGEILAEKAVTPLREINCSVMGEGADCEASLLEEPLMKDEILSYDDKYRSGEKGMASQGRKCPADLAPAKTEEIRELAKRAFAAIKASGVARVDFLLDGNEKVYINEINTIPGSLSFYLWEPAGIPYPELIDRLADIAFKRRRDRERVLSTIDSNILSENAFSFGKAGKTGGKYSG